VFILLLIFHNAQNTEQLTLIRP